MVKYLHDDDLDDKLGNDYEDDNIAMGMGGCFPHSNKIREEYYNVGHGNVDTYEYQNGDIHIQISEQGKTMTVDEQDMHIIVIVMIQYSRKQGLRIFGKKSEEYITE